MCSPSLVTRCAIAGLLVAGCGGPALQPTFEAICQSPTVLSFDSVRSFVGTLHHSNAYTPLDLDQMNAIRAAARALNTGDVQRATTEAELAGYEVVPLTTAGACNLVLRPTDGAAPGQGTLIVPAAWRRDLVIEAPHIPNDFRTDEEAALLFAAVEARSLVLAGADRCAVTSSSGCHANHECNAAGVAVESDPSHSERSAVHAMHLALALDNDTSVTLQLHTNVAPSLNGDAQISNGTRYPIQGAAADTLYATFQPSGFDVRTCNDPDVPPAIGAFCGEVNAQSLASNGSTDACNGHVSHAGAASRHRFIQLEQNNRQLTSLEPWVAALTAAIVDAIPLH